MLLLTVPTVKLNGDSRTSMENPGENTSGVGGRMLYSTTRTAIRPTVLNVGAGSAESE